MSTVITQTEKDKLYTQIFHLLGMPVRGVELTEEQMDSFLELSMNDYEQYVHNWLIESQWSSLVNVDVDTISLTRAFTTRSLDYETQYSYAYSKIVGLQAGGPWELKKDYIELSANTQTYIIPAGREINELLWFTRAELTDSIVDPFLGGFGGLGGVGFGGVGGFAQIGTSGSYFMLPAFDLLLRMQDRSMKNKLIGGELTYRITAGPNGTKLVHLYNTPGGRFDFGSIQQHNYKVWYWYYETTDNRDECLAANKDIVKLPSDVQTEGLLWSDLNRPAQNWVRRYLMTYAKEGLARIWGKFSGDLQVPDSTIKLDYTSLLTEAKDDRMKLIEELIGAEGILTRLRPEKLMERRKLEAENLNGAMKYRAMPVPIIPI
ncbi:MAG: hypothetical protein RIR48_1739 [Bacteroidota bacterium]